MRKKPAGMTERSRIPLRYPLQSSAASLNEMDSVESIDHLLPVIEPPFLVRIDGSLYVRFDVDEIAARKVSLPVREIEFAGFGAKGIIPLDAIFKDAPLVVALAWKRLHPHAIRRDLAADMRIAVEHVRPVDLRTVTHDDGLHSALTRFTDQGRGKQIVTETQLSPLRIRLIPSAASRFQRAIRDVSASARPCRSGHTTGGSGLGDCRTQQE